MFEFLMAQIATPEASIDPPPEEAIRFLEEKSGALDAMESLLIAGPPPEWAFDLSVPENDRRMPNGLGHIRLQRALMARALAASRSGHGDAPTPSLEASWNLNESLRGRPETVPALLGIAISRLEVGVLRKVSVEEDLWRKRLATLDSRDSASGYGRSRLSAQVRENVVEYVSEEYGEGLVAQTGVECPRGACASCLDAPSTPT